MHPEIEKLIDIALADGQITEKERNVILKKANELGVDADEVEMILDGKLHQLEANKPKQKEKVGNVKTCPACGALVKSFQFKCEDCGHEFRFENDHEYSISSLNKKLTEVDSKHREQLNRESRSTNLFFRFLESHKYQPYIISKDIAMQQATVINSWPVRNTKEDILEFLYLAISEVKGKKRTQYQKFNEGYESEYKDILYRAWLAKSIQLIEKAQKTFSNDNEMISEVNRISSVLGF